MPYVRKARIADVRHIHALLMAQQKGVILLRSLSQLYNHVREFFVLVEDDDVTLLGCSSLSVLWEGEAEVRSLAVAEAMRGKGYGRVLVGACLAEAKELGIDKVFALTYKVPFFVHIGFHEVDKSTLPQKIWADCIHCPHFPDCEEVAVLVELKK